MLKPVFCICENKGTDQLCGNRTADQRLCFRYITSTTPLLPKFQASSLFSVVVQPGLCWTWSETTKTDFFMMPLTFVYVKTVYDVIYMNLCHLYIAQSGATQPQRLTHCFFEIWS